jgi:hypothetical protein
MQSDNQTQLLTHYQNLYLKAAALHKNAQQLHTSLSENDNEPLLKKALDQGEIPLLTYLLELEYYYDAFQKKLEAEREYARALAELMVVEEGS